MARSLAVLRPRRTEKHRGRVYHRREGRMSLKQLIGLDNRSQEYALAEPMLASFFTGVNLPRLKAHQFAFLSQALGGARQYTGASMAQAHARLRIEQHHFDRVATHLVETLRELDVKEDWIAQVAAAVTPLASEIVNTRGAAQ
jgi:hemoglobin